MIPYTIYSTIDFGFFHIYVWGLLVAIGFLVGILLAVSEAKKRKLNVDHIYDISFYAILGGIVGGRIGYILTHLSDFKNFFDWFAVWNGGMSFYGGLVFATLFCYLYIRKHKLNFWKYADVFSIPLVVGFAIGRIGCYLSGQHLGSITNLPWAINVNGTPRHPVPAYEFISLAAIALILLQLKKKKLKNGVLFLSTVALYSIVRFFLTFLRIEDPTFYGLTGSQYVSLFLIAVCSYLIYKKIK